MSVPGARATIFSIINHYYNHLPPHPIFSLNRVHEISNKLSRYVLEATIKHYGKLKYFLPAMLHEVLNPGNRLGNLGYGGSIGAAHISFAAFAKGIARHQSHMLLHEKLFRKFLRG